MPLEQRLEHMGLNVAEYKQLRNSERKAAKKFANWEPKTKEEAQRKWKKMQETPDHLNLLELFKREGIEPLKVAKYVFNEPYLPKLY